MYVIFAVESNQIHLFCLFVDKWASAIAANWWRRLNTDSLTQNKTHWHIELCARECEFNRSLCSERDRQRRWWMPFRDCVWLMKCRVPFKPNRFSWSSLTWALRPNSNQHTHTHQCWKCECQQWSQRSIRFICKFILCNLYWINLLIFKQNYGDNQHKAQRTMFALSCGNDLFKFFDHK